MARTSWLLCVSLFFLHYSLCVLGVTSAENLLCLLCKTILKVSYLIIILWISLEKAECFDFIHSLGCVYPTLYISSRSSLSFELADYYPCLFVNCLYLPFITLCHPFFLSIILFKKILNFPFWPIFEKLITPFKQGIHAMLYLFPGLC